MVMLMIKVYMNTVHGDANDKGKYMNSVHGDSNDKGKYLNTLFTVMLMIKVSI